MPQFLKPSSLLWKACWIGWIGVTLFFSLIPAGISPPSGVSDKWEHAVSYSILCLLTFLAGYTPFKSLIFATIMGIAMEIGQIFSPGRHFDIYDVAANSAGTFLVYSLLILILKRPTKEA